MSAPNAWGFCNTCGIEHQLDEAHPSWPDIVKAADVCPHCGAPSCYGHICTACRLLLGPALRIAR